MTGFSFQTARSIICEPGAIKRLGTIAAEYGISRVLVVTDKGIVSAGLLEQALGGLESGGISAFVYSDVVADPPEQVVLEALALAMAQGVDGVIGFGGGSSMDVAKLVSFLSISRQSLAEIYGVGLAKGSRLPLIQVPTTAGTGSEVTPVAIVTTGASEKKGVVAPQLLPDVAVLDADLTLKLPPLVTATTGLDAMVHAIEASTSKIKKNPLSDMLAREAMKLLFGNIRNSVSDGNNQVDRSNMLLGSMLAGQAFANAPVGAVHALALPVGGHFHVAHGLANAILLPHVMRFNAPVAAGEYASLARLLWPNYENESDLSLSERMIAELEELMRDIKLQTTLRQVGVEEKHLPVLAEDAMKQQRLLVNNPRDVSYQDALSIYTQAL